MINNFRFLISNQTFYEITLNRDEFELIIDFDDSDNEFRKWLTSNDNLPRGPFKLKYGIMEFYNFKTVSDIVLIIRKVGNSESSVKYLPLYKKQKELSFQNNIYTLDISDTMGFKSDDMFNYCSLKIMSGSTSDWEIKIYGEVVPI